MKKFFGIIYLIIYVISLILPKIDETNILRDAPFFHSIVISFIMLVAVLSFIGGIISLIRGKHKAWEAVVTIIGSLFLLFYFLIKSNLAYGGTMMDIDRQINAFISLTTSGYRLVLIFGIGLTYLGFVYDKKVSQADKYNQMYQNPYNVPPMNNQNVPPMNNQNVPPMNNQESNYTNSQGASMNTDASQVKSSINIDIKDEKEKIAKGFNKVKAKVDTSFKRKNEQNAKGTNAKYMEFVRRYEHDLEGLAKCVQVNIISHEEYVNICAIIERNKEEFMREVQESKNLFLAQPELYNDLVVKGIISPEMDQAVCKEVEAK